jgi:hypothetical protein
VQALAVIGALLVVAPATAAPGFPACLAGCEGSPDCCDAFECLRGPCGGYLGCIADARDAYGECISGISERRRCRTATGGRCTIVLSCVRACKTTRRITVKKCAKQNLRNLTDVCTGCGKLKPREQRALATVCTNACANPTPTTTSTAVTTTSTSTTSSTGTAATTTVTTTSTPQPTFTCEGAGIDRCTNDCLMRIDSLKRDYGRCDDSCHDDDCAVVICREISRNVACKAIKARCSSDGDNIDPAYTQCCAPDNCNTAAEAPCRILETTTSTSSTTIVASTTSTSVRTPTTSPF